MYMFIKMDRFATHFFKIIGKVEFKWYNYYLLYNRCYLVIHILNVVQIDNWQRFILNRHKNIIKSSKGRQRNLIYE